MLANKTLLARFWVRRYESHPDKYQGNITRASLLTSSTWLYPSFGNNDTKEKQLQSTLKRMKLCLNSGISCQVNFVSSPVQIWLTLYLKMEICKQVFLGIGLDFLLRRRMK